ncbi:MAG: ribosomal-processing cysteine protease Prp [Peptoniphilus sp.]|nr:ribosomal-processing cysteine protease Prp [Peptoniphilus sp.]MDY3118551.1 ribosomal-processing cysteine protease Prp [Peptoniphilus sp.]
MTRVILFVRRGKILGFLANNHAGQGDAIGEIVCHGVSALTLTCALSMETLLSMDEDTMHYEQAEAYISVRLPEEKVSRETELLFRSMVVGLEAIEGAYKNYITIETQEV